MADLEDETSALLRVGLPKSGSDLFDCLNLRFVKERVIAAACVKCAKYVYDTHLSLCLSKL